MEEVLVRGILCYMFGPNSQLRCFFLVVIFLCKLICYESKLRSEHNREFAQISLEYVGFLSFHSTGRNMRKHKEAERKRNGNKVSSVPPGLYLNNTKPSPAATQHYLLRFSFKITTNIVWQPRISARKLKSGPPYTESYNTERFYGVSLGG